MSLVPHKQTFTYSLADIKTAAEFCISHFEPGGTYIFSGDLGAGKTTLIAAIVSVMGCRETVSSPTYVLQHIYTGMTGKIVDIEHWDLYRTQSLPEEIEQSPKPNTIRLIEWGEKFEDIHSNGRIFLSIIDNSTRILDFYILR